MTNFDVIIIGTGAGNIIADAAIANGKSVAIIEKGAFGGTCLNRGCIPTKVMVTAANRVREIRESARIGVNAGEPSIDWEVLSERLWHKIGENKGIKEYYAQFPNVHIYEGTASFASSKVIHISMNDGGSEMIRGEKIFIGVGARTNIPKIEGLKETGYITSESFFGEKFPKKPYKSLIIIGGGPIGCEFAHALDAAGTKVTIIQHNVRLLPKEDEDISAFLLKQFLSYGIDVKLNKNTISVHKEGNEKVLIIKDRATGIEEAVKAEEILVSPGIVPVSDLLHLENTSVKTDKRGYILTNEFLETTQEGIWAIGDINGQAPFRHKANNEAEIASHNLFYEKDPQKWRWMRYDCIPAVTYTYPEAAHVGLTEADARKKGFEVDVAVNHYSASAKGYALGFEPGDEDDGFIKLILDKKTEKILGAYIIGPEASILIQPFVKSMVDGTSTVTPVHEEIGSETVRSLRALPLKRTLDSRSLQSFDETMTPHPSLSEFTMWTRYYYKPERLLKK